MIYETINVPLGERSYPVYVGRELVSNFAPTCESHAIPKDVAIITDTNVAALYLKPLVRNLIHFKFRPVPIVIPPGERQKSLNRADKIFSELMIKGFGRDSAVLALGGGVIGDLSGFIAATYCRGVSFVQIPTTFLAQVDSAIGGKVAINHPLGKNMIGAFFQPKFAWVDVSHLRTLPFRELACGLGEIIKYGIIWDSELFYYLQTHLDDVLNVDQNAVLHVQSRCCGIKAHIVSIDEKEAGLRTILNYGHTVGHALEVAGGFSVLKHGEAVLLGMMAESFIAQRLGMISDETHDQIVGLIRRVPLKTSVRKLKSGDILKAMRFDKKSIQGKKRFVLPTRIGEVKVVESIDEQLVRASLSYMLKAMSSSMKKVT